MKSAFAVATFTLALFLGHAEATKKVNRETMKDPYGTCGGKPDGIGSFEAANIVGMVTKINGEKIKALLGEFYMNKVAKEEKVDLTAICDFFEPYVDNMIDRYTTPA